MKRHKATFVSIVPSPYQRDLFAALAARDDVELNVYYIPTTIDLTGSEVENIYVEILRDVKRVVQIPVAMKLSPFFSSTVVGPFWAAREMVMATMKTNEVMNLLIFRLDQRANFRLSRFCHDA